MITTMTKMRFGPFQWPANPTEIQVEGGRQIQETTFPAPSLRETGPRLRTVNGKGFFTGPDAAAQFAALHALLTKGGAEALTLPEYGPMMAVLSELTLLRGHMRMVEYAFLFRESPMEAGSAPCEDPAVRIAAGETLWDLAARHAIPIERLLALNPGLADPWSAGEGTEVKLR